jgi:Uma2 family endonuclease
MRTMTRPAPAVDLDLVDTYDEKTGHRYEIIDGDVVMSPPPIPFHQALTNELVTRFNAVVRPRRLGRVYPAPVEVRLARTARPMPDLVYVSREHREIVGDKVIEGPPDLVVEILSPSTRGNDLGRKRELYARYGIREYWIVDPKERDIIVLVLQNGRYVQRPNEEGVARSVVLPELTINVAEFFTAAEEW